MTLRCGLLFLSVAIVVIPGCASQSPAPVSALPVSDISGADIARCEKELMALKALSNSNQTELDGKFEHVMSGAASYANVRNVVDPETQRAVDALYHFRSAKVCAEIRSRMLESLVAQSGVAQ